MMMMTSSKKCCVCAFSEGRWHTRAHWAAEQHFSSSSYSSRDEIYTRSTFLMVIKRVHNTADDSKKCIDMSCIMGYNVDMDVCPRERIKRSPYCRSGPKWMGRWQGEQMKGEKEKKKKKKILCRVYYNHVVTQSETSSSHPARYNIYCSIVDGYTELECVGYIHPAISCMTI